MLSSAQCRSFLTLANLFFIFMFSFLSIFHVKSIFSCGVITSFKKSDLTRNLEVERNIFGFSSTLADLVKQPLILWKTIMSCNIQQIFKGMAIAIIYLLFLYINFALVHTERLIFSSITISNIALSLYLTTFYFALELTIIKITNSFKSSKFYTSPSRSVIKWYNVAELIRNYFKANTHWVWY